MTITTYLERAATVWLDWMLPMGIQLAAFFAIVLLLDRALGRRAWPQLLCALWLLVFVKLVIPPNLSSPVSLANCLPQQSALTVVRDPASNQQPAREPGVASGVADHSAEQAQTPAGLNSSQSRFVAADSQLSAMEPSTLAASLPTDRLPTSLSTRRQRERDSEHAFAWPTLANATWGAEVWGAGVWLAGVLALLSLVAGKHFRLKRLLLLDENPNDASARIPPRLRNRATELSRQLGIKRPPRLVVTSRPVGPAVLGAFCPVIVLPAVLVKTASREELEHILLHELSHIRRRDPLLNLLSLMLAALYWFHPCVWLARRKFQAAQEIACDQMVAATLCGAQRDYRRTLLSLSRPMWAPTGLSFFPRKSELLTRLERLDRPVSPFTRGRKLLTCAVGAVMFLCVMPMATCQSAGAVTMLEENGGETATRLSHALDHESTPDETESADSAASAAPADRDFAGSIIERARRNAARNSNRNAADNTDPDRRRLALPNPATTETQPVSFVSPPFDELQGCMQKRYAVMAALARKRNAANE